MAAPPDDAVASTPMVMVVTLIDPLLVLTVEPPSLAGQPGTRLRRDARLIGRAEAHTATTGRWVIGGAETLAGPTGSTAARTMAEICAGQPVEIKVEGGSRLTLQVGEALIVDGQRLPGGPLQAVLLFDLPGPAEALPASVDARLTMGGVPLVPTIDGGKNAFSVDLLHLPQGAVGWIPTPALTAQLEQPVSSPPPSPPA